MAALAFLHALCLVLISQASPVPGRIPKVYNALITSNQNLEPSKSYPVYQPVIHDPFAYQYQPVFYPSPDFTNLQPRTSGQPQPQPPQFTPQSPQYPQQEPQFSQQGPQFPQQGPQFPQQGPQFPQQGPQFPQFPQQLPQFPHQGPQFPQQGPQFPQQGPQYPQQGSQIPQQQPIPSDPQSSTPQSPPGSASETVPEITPPSPDQLIPQPRPGPKDEEAAAASTPSPPLPPNTESPIPLNQFGLPPQVVPLGRINPAYQGFNQVSPFTYSYPSYRFYDPYDPFSLNPYNYPALYRPSTNGIGPSTPVGAPEAAQPSASVPGPAPKNSNNDQKQPQPPSEPDNLNVLNYSAKDPAIPNVPPPPLPEGGLKTNEPEQE